MSNDLLSWPPPLRPQSPARAEEVAAATEKVLDAVAALAVARAEDVAATKNAAAAKAHDGKHQWVTAPWRLGFLGGRVLRGDDDASPGTRRARRRGARRHVRRRGRLWSVGARARALEERARNTPVKG